jgi:hypothetical protein
MKKRFTRLLAALGFLAAIGAVGGMQYFNSGDNRGKATEAAADAVGAAANAALELTRDRSERTVEVVALMGQAPTVVSVRALLTMRGANKLSAVCASLPRIHDAITVLLFDKLRQDIAAGRGIDPVQLAAHETRLLDMLNRSYDEPTIDLVRLSPGNSALSDGGCTDKNSRKPTDKAASAAH